MATPYRRLPRSLALAVMALLAAAMLAAALAAPSREHVQPPAPPRSVHVQDVQAALDEATDALLARDRAAWSAALPTAGSSSRRAVVSLYRCLERLPWTELRLMAEPVAGRVGRFWVGAVGEVGGAGPDDRIFGRLVVDVGLRKGRVVVLDDVTPPLVRGQQVMAFKRPLAVRRNGLVVVAESRDRIAAEALADAGGPARKRLTLLGITSREPVIVYYYSAREQLLRSLGEEPGEKRIRFFSHAPVRLGDGPTWARDVGVLGPALEGKGSWAPRMLAHELTHAYTSRWFEGARHAPTLLAEGLATAVEGGRSFQPLRDDLATGEQAFPLEEALRARSLWDGNSIDKVRLAYLEGASLVLYVLDNWGLRHLKSFVSAVSDSDLTCEGLDRASRTSLGVGWKVLRSGWVEYVATLP